MMRVIDQTRHCWWIERSSFIHIRGIRRSTLKDHFILTAKHIIIIIVS